MCVIQIYLDISVGSSTEVKIFCFTISNLNKDRRSECIETFPTIACNVWNLVEYVGFTNQYIQFPFNIWGSCKCSQYIFLT